MSARGSSSRNERQFGINWPNKSGGGVAQTTRHPATPEETGDDDG